MHADSWRFTARILLNRRSPKNRLIHGVKIIGGLWRNSLKIKPTHISQSLSSENIYDARVKVVATHKQNNGQI